MIYSITKNFPKYELYGLTNQIRRVSVSIPNNIAEGIGRISKKEFKHFLQISIGSLFELQTQLELSNNLQFVSEIEFNRVLN